jgi:SAM-dependent methyltransferase
MRDAFAVGVGTFIGCTPFFGFHLALVFLMGRVLRLNRLKMYLASNISNPLMAPALLLIELQTGAWLQRRDFHGLTLASIRAMDPWAFGSDLLLGALVVGIILATLATVLTAAAVGPSRELPPHIDRVFAAAAERYLESGITAWEFARGKLKGDPVYGTVLVDFSGDGGTFVDIGCGQGLALAAIVEARRLVDAGEWPADTPPPPAFDRLIGIEMRPRVVSIARQALGNDALIIEAAAPAGFPEQIDAAVMFDVLHLLPRSEQAALIVALGSAMRRSSVVLVREADSAGGFRFRVTRLGNQLKALVAGRWSQRFAFRTVPEWTAFFTEHGWVVETLPMSDATPFANVLFVLTRR